MIEISRSANRVLSGIFCMGGGRGGGREGKLILKIVWSHAVGRKCF